MPSLAEGLVEFEALLEREEETLNDLDEVNPEEILNKLSSSRSLIGDLVVSKKL